MKLYRVDKRLYNVGDEILPDTNYPQALNNEDKEILERKLDEKRTIKKLVKSTYSFLIHCITL